MMFRSLLRTRRHAVASPPDPILPGAALPLWCAGGASACSAGAWIVTGEPWIAGAVGATGLAFAGWRVAVAFAGLRAALENARRERAAVEETLKRSQKMEALGRLAVGIAHDFNNHLTVISSNVELVKRRLDGGHERLHRHADAAMQGVQRAAALTGRLLSYSRQPDCEPEPVDVRRLLAGLSDLLSRSVSEGIAVTIEDEGDTWYVWADVNELENALLSLAVNVRDQVPDGGALTVRIDNVRLDAAFAEPESLVLPGDYVRIAVGASELSAGGPRTGWRVAGDAASADLSLARSFVREAGGYLLRSDRAGAAMALRLFLPRYVPSQAALPRARLAGGPATVLVVEDDDAVRQACVEALSALDYRVLEAPDAMEAFRLIADHGGIDLLLTDLGLPGGVSGKALADAARNVDQRMRVVFTTGYDRVDLGGHAGSVLLRKPFSPAQLADCVRNALSERDTADGASERLTA